MHDYGPSNGQGDSFWWKREGINNMGSFHPVGNNGIVLGVDPTLVRRVVAELVSPQS